jgi:hypothetical protein
MSESIRLSPTAVTKGLTNGHHSFFIRDFVLPTGKSTIELKRLIKDELTLAKIDAELDHIEVGYPSPKDKYLRSTAKIAGTLHADAPDSLKQLTADQPISRSGLADFPTYGHIASPNGGAKRAKFTLLPSGAAVLRRR